MAKVVRIDKYLFKKINKLPLSEIVDRAILEAIERLQGKGMHFVLDYRGIRKVSKKDLDNIISIIPDKYLKQDKEFPSILFLNGELAKEGEIWFLKTID